MQLKRRRCAQKQEAGYILLFFLVILAAMILAMTVAAPRLAQQIKRDREIEMIHRGEQYARAVKRYYHKFGRFPGRIEDLEKTNTIRFLRKRYKDPMAKDGGWRILHYGEVQLLAGNAGGASLTQQPGQTTGASPAAGAAGAATSGSTFSLNFSGNAATPAANAPAAAAVTGAATPTGTPTPGATPTGATATGTDTPAGASTAIATTADSSGSGASAGASSYAQTTTGSSASSSPTTASPGSTTASTGSLFSAPATSAQPGGGGGPMIGVASLSKAQGIHEFNQKSAYKDWLFLYDPAQDRGNLLRGPYNPKAYYGQFNTQSATTAQPGQTNASGSTGLSFAPASPATTGNATGQSQPSSGQPATNAAPAPAMNPAPTTQ